MYTLQSAKDSASLSSAATRVFVSGLRVDERIWAIELVEAMRRTTILSRDATDQSRVTLADQIIGLALASPARRLASPTLNPWHATHRDRSILKTHLKRKIHPLFPQIPFPDCPTFLIFNIKNATTTPIDDTCTFNSTGLDFPLALFIFFRH